MFVSSLSTVLCELSHVGRVADCKMLLQTGVAYVLQQHEQQAVSVV